MQAARVRKERIRQDKLAAEEAEREEVRLFVHLCSSMRRATSASVRVKICRTWLCCSLGSHLLLTLLQGSAAVQTGCISSRAAVDVLIKRAAAVSNTSL
jgi:NADH:ubiquinone oxidoreductase subunit E